MEKLKVSLKYWLIGKKYFTAVKALNFAEKYHIGKRKNGDPEFIHQITIGQLVRVFAAGNLLLGPEQTIKKIIRLLQINNKFLNTLKQKDM